ncbi:17506_t:CDS:2, partial [Dentiscutata erythropus]
ISSFATGIIIGVGILNANGTILVFFSSTLSSLLGGVLMFLLLAVFHVAIVVV